MLGAERHAMLISDQWIDTDQHAAVCGRAPIFDQYFSGMEALVRELRDARSVEGRRVKELLRLGVPR